MEFTIILLVIVSAFILEFLDAYIGMGFGIMTPILFLLGFPLLEIIPAVIVTSALLNTSASFFHHKIKNIDFFKKENKSYLKIILLFGVMAVLAGVFVAINIPQIFLQIYIGLLVATVGILILVSNKTPKKINKKRLWIFAILASFNKGISGGGYGPVLSTGQVYSGINAKKAVGITSISEGIISLIGFILYFIINGTEHINLILIPILFFSGILATPLAAIKMKNTKIKKLKIMMSISSIILGIFIIIKAI